MTPPIRPETVIFSVLVAFLAWWLLELPPVQKAVAMVAAVAVFVAASAAIERWRRSYLEAHLDDGESDDAG